MPEYVKFRRQFVLSDRTVVVEQELERMNFIESMAHAKVNGGRLLRLVEIEKLLKQVNGPLCPEGEMWISTAYDKWIQVGPYVATFQHLTGSKVNKRGIDYNIYRREPYGNLGQLYIMEGKQRNKSIKDVLKHFN